MSGSRPPRFGAERLANSSSSLPFKQIDALRELTHPWSGLSVAIIEIAATLLALNLPISTSDWSEKLNPPMSAAA